VDRALAHGVLHGAGARARGGGEVVVDLASCAV
jgi:hypothetical protein